MSKAIEELQNEHNAILSGLQILEAIISRIDRGLDVEKRDTRDLLAFLKDFVDKCHHGKEESLLFPAMLKAGALEGNPVEVMLAEHKKGRELAKQMEEAFAGVPAYPHFASVAKEYAHLLRSHMQTENGAFFPLAESILGEQQLDHIYQSYEQYEQQVMGAGRHEELHAKLKALKQKYFV